MLLSLEIFINRYLGSIAVLFPRLTSDDATTAKAYIQADQTKKLPPTSGNIRKLSLKHIRL